LADGDTAPATVEAGPKSWGMRLRGSMMPVFIGLTVALIALTLVIAQTIVTQRDARLRALNEGNTLFALQAVMQTVLEAESSQRGYVLTADSTYLTPYLAAKERLGPMIVGLRKIAAQARDDETAGRTNWIAGLADAKFAEMDRTVALTRTGFQAQAQEIVNSDIGRQQMETIRAAIERESRRKAQLRLEAFERASKLELRLIPLIAVLGIAIVALVYAGFRTERGRAAAEAQAEQADALREANALAQLLTRELNHRVKNLFSVILSIVALSGRKQAPTREVIESIRARIHALSLAHATSQGAIGHASVQLEPVIAGTMEPYADEEGLRVRVGGPEVELPVRMITPIGMIVHELATNAVKYGALSVEGGSVEIAWERQAGEGADQVTLTWIETGGPPLPSADEARASTGFGSQMIRLAANQIGGAVEREWPAGGALVRLTFPLPQS